MLSLVDVGLAFSSSMVVKCDACEAIGATSRCSACKTSVYCNSTCAKKHWKAGHREVCKAWVDNRKRIEEVDLKVDTIIARIQGLENDKETCCICLESALSIDNSFFLPCKHFLCGKCVYKLPEKHHVVEDEDGDREVLRIERAKCPLCRAELPEMNAWLQYLYESACELIQRANRLPKGSEERAFLCSYSSHQCRLLENFLLDIISEKGPSNNSVANHGRISKLLDLVLVDIRLCEGNPEACLEKAQELLSNGSFSDNKPRRVDLFIKIGESYVELKDFEKATKLGFLEALKLVDQTMAGPSRKIYHALIQCFYELEDYTKALGCGEAAVEMNRHYDGLYKYIALSHKAVGDLDMAIDTMSDAVVYEAPWDELGRAENKRLLEELKYEQHKRHEQQQQQQQEG